MKKKISTQPKLKVRRGDYVQVIAGDSKGIRGEVLEILLKRNRAVVKGANMISKHTKPNATNPNGGIVKKEATIHISNLMLVDTSIDSLTRVGRIKSNGDKLIRVSKKSGKEI